MTALGALQGLALWALYDHWPEEAPRLRAVFVGVIFFIVVSGLVIHLARSARHQARLGATAGALGLAFGAIALWVSWQLPGSDAPYQGDEARVASWICAAAIALYVLGPFVQIHQESGRLRFPYPALYRHSWNNFFIVCLGGVFAGALWLVLLLWMTLFNLIEIGFFEDVFTEPLFAYPTTGAALAYGLAVGKESESIIATLRGLTQSLFRVLLPLVALVTLGFLASLPFTGLDPLFAQRSAASIVIAWIATYVLFLNAVYLDGSSIPPYAAPLRRTAEAGTLLLPLLAGIGLYAVYLRAAQYGLTPERIFAFVLAGVLELYALGYAAAVALRGEPWLPRVRTVNVGMAWVVIGIALALHTPLLDPISWSLRDQLHRLRSGRASADDFDFGYLRFQLGRRGDAALRSLQASLPEGVAEAARPRIELALHVASYQDWLEEGGPSFRRDGVELIPAGAPWPAGLEDAVRAAAQRRRNLRECGGRATCLLLEVELRSGGRKDALLAVHLAPSFELLVFEQRHGSRWEWAGQLQPGPGYPSSKESQAWLDALRQGRFETVLPEDRDLLLGGRRFRLQPVR